MSKSRVKKGGCCFYKIFSSFIFLLLVLWMTATFSVLAAEDTNGAADYIGDMRPAEMVLKDSARVLRPKNISPAGGISTMAGWETVFEDDFEGSWPGSWIVSDQDPTSGSDYWGRVTCKPGGEHSGSYSVWCAAEGDKTDCGSSYDYYMYSWMVYGSFSLADCTDGEIDFYYVDESELDYDGFFFGVAIDGENFYGYIHTGTTTGYPNTWQHYVLDLTNIPTLGNVCGESQVWFAFVFISDSIYCNYRGAYIDDVTIRRYTEPEPTGEIHGSKWDDSDSNGEWDGGEPGLPDWKIYIDENTNGQWDSGEPYDWTDSGGGYSFTDLAAGTYFIGEVPQEGWEQTYPEGEVVTTMQAGPTTYGDLLTPEELANIERIDMDSPPTPPVGIERTAVKSVPMSAVMLSDVPTSTWTYGCSATSAGMLFGYYDRTGYPNMYTGPTNGGIAPLTDLCQGIDTPISGSCSICATQDGFDGRTSKGHVDDYWIDYLEPGPDPWEGNWSEHTWGDCTADYMGTNQWKWDWDCAGGTSANVDGSTTLFYSDAKLYDYVPEACAGLPQTALCHGMRLFAESRGYTVLENYNQSINGFTFDDYKAEIDAGRPVLIHVTGHTMVGVGYDDAGQTVYLHDTWDNSVHSMTWGGSYSGMNHIAVTVIRLEPILEGMHKVVLGAGEVVSDIDFGNCSIETPPEAYDSSVTTFIDTPVTITLQASDDGKPDPPAELTYTIESLPSHGDLNEPGVGLITEPCTPLVSNLVEYMPDIGYTGADSFTFEANDGGTAPEGGSSNEATVYINVTPCILFDDFPSMTLDTNNWSDASGTPVIDDSAGNEPSPPYSLHLEATDSVTSKMIDLYECWSAHLEFWWKRSGTESGDDLCIDYWDGNEWILLYTLPAGGDTEWELDYVELPDAALHSEFYLRFRADCDASGDEWYIDDVCIQCQCCVEPPVLHPEPNSSWDSSSVISWDSTAYAEEYYAECATDSDFNNIDASSGWIADLNCEFSGLIPGQKYWYHVKAWTPFLPKMWLQTSQADFETDTLTDTETTSEGDVVLRADIGTPVTDIVGGTSSSITNYNYLNCFYVPTETVLNKIEVYLGILSSRGIEFVVYEGGSSFSDPYNLIHTSTLAHSGTGTKFYSSGPIYVPLEADTHYLIGAIYNGIATTYYNAGFDSPSFGDHVGYGFYNGFPSPATITNISSSGFAFYHRYTSGMTINFDGDIVSTPISLPDDGDWQMVNFDTTIPADTALSFDILPAAGTTPIPGYENVSDGTDLSGISNTNIRLRANLSASEVNSTPILHYWSVSYTDPCLACESDWSNSESTFQCGAPGDFEPDCDVDWYDLQFLADYWLNDCNDFDNWCYGRDLDYSGAVNFNDFAILGEYWLKGD